MRAYILRRLLIMIPVFIGITIIVFALVYLTPGDPFSAMLEVPGISPEQLETLKVQSGYYDPLPIKYFKWVKNLVLHGDLGYSSWYHEPVTDVIGRRLGNTLLLSLPSLIIGVVFAVPLGIISATKKYSVFDYIATFVALIGISIPSFFFALGLIKIFGIDLSVFPMSGMQSVPNKEGMAQIFDVLWHMVLPVFVLGFMQMASLMRYTRSSMIDVMQQDYIRTARAKGLSERVVIYRHALRNSLTQLVTMITLSMGGLFSGAVLVETVFTWPGMGSLIYSAIGQRDYNLITAGTLLISLTVLLANLLADILYAVVDPRVKFK